MYIFFGINICILSLVTIVHLKFCSGIKVKGNSYYNIYSRGNLWYTDHRASDARIKVTHLVWGYNEQIWFQISIDPFFIDPSIPLFKLFNFDGGLPMSFFIGWAQYGYRFAVLSLVHLSDD